MGRVGRHRVDSCDRGLGDRQQPWCDYTASNPPYVSYANACRTLDMPVRPPSEGHIDTLRLGNHHAAGKIVELEGFPSQYPFFGLRLTGGLLLAIMILRC
jgi:hypothetical protein